MNKHYRADIDGLRAFAVLSVFLYHINPAFLPSGFVGVDIFFVISGFVITSSVLSNLEKFSWVEFYCKRIKRILPMMFLVLSSVLILAILLYTNDNDIFHTTDATKAAASYVYNIYLMLHSTGYFESPSQQQPLLHMWSLSVEEQFYLLFPFLCYYGYKKSFLKTNWVVLFLILGSLIFSEYSLRLSWNNLAYYSLFSRAYELLTGVSLAYYVLHFKGQYKLLCKIISITGVICLIYGVLFLQYKPFPGLWGLVPTIGTAFLLIGGASEKQNFITRILSCHLLRFLGKISYSLYLWHWVVISFYKYETSWAQPSLAEAVILFLVTLVLSIASYFYIETPFRYKHNISTKKTIIQYQVYPLAAFLIFTTIATIATRKIGLVKFTMSHKLVLENTHPHGFCHGGDIVGNCVFGADTDTSVKVAVYGDSHAAAIAPFLEEFAKYRHFKIYMRSNGCCMPLVEDDSVLKENWAPGNMKEWCLRQNHEMLNDLPKYEVIMLVVYWPQDLKMTVGSYNLLKEMHHTIDYLLARGKSVVLFGDIPTYDQGKIETISRREKLQQYLPFLPAVQTSFVANNESTNTALQKLVDDYHGKAVYYFNTQKEITSKIKDYPYIDDYIIYSDANHLNPEGAKKLFKYVSVYNPDSLSKLYMILSTNNKK